MDEESYVAWVQGTQQRLLRSAFLICGDLTRAEDLVQEALVKVALRWERLRDANPTAYARTIIVRDHISWWRRNRREVVALVDIDQSHDRDIEPRLVVARALARLTRSQRAVLVLRHLDDLSERETAEILGVSVGTVKSQNAAALARLREGAPELLALIGRTE